MSLKIEGSEAAEIAQVYPFDLPGTQKTIENAYYEFYDPSVNISDAPSAAQRNLRWEVSGSPDMTDLKNSYILMRVALTKATGAYAAADKIGLSPGWSQLLVDRLNLYLNGVNLSEGDHYAFKGWVASILEEESGWATEPIVGDPATQAMKQGDGEHEGWALDYPGLSEENDNDANEARNYATAKYAKSADGFTIIVRPRETMFLQDDFLLPQIKLKLEMLTTSPVFWVNSATAALSPLLSIQSARLFLKRIQLTPSAERTLLSTLTQTPAKYIFPRMRYTNQVVGTTQSRQVVSLLPGPRPNRVIVFFSKTAGADPATGNLANNPVAFTEFDDAANYVERIYINVAGRQFPRKELEAVAKNDIHRAYEMYKLGCSDAKKPLLPLDQFNNNYTIFVFNTTKSLMNDDEGVLHSGAMTDVQVNYRFNAAPTADVSLHVIAVDDGVVEIDAAGQVSKNY